MSLVNGLNAHLPLDLLIAGSFATQPVSMWVCVCVCVCVCEQERENKIIGHSHATIWWCIMPDNYTGSKNTRRWRSPWRTERKVCGAAGLLQARASICDPITSSVMDTFSSAVISWCLRISHETHKNRSVRRGIPSTTCVLILLEKCVADWGGNLWHKMRDFAWKENTQARLVSWRIPYLNNTIYMYVHVYNSRYIILLWALVAKTRPRLDVQK
jgi:hypothetical protein